MVTLGRACMALCALVFLPACAAGAAPDPPVRLSVVASFFPVADAVHRVGGGLVSVRNLTPAGVEPHDLELTSRDVDRILDAHLVFYVGSGFQPAVAAAARRRDRPSIDVASRLINAGNNGTDPHFWLDPTRMAQAVETIKTALIAADPNHASTYATNAATYKAELLALDADYAATLRTCQRREIVTAHAAFAYLAVRYGLAQLAVAGVSPEAEADPKRVAALADLIKRDGVTTVFYEALVPRDFADVLAKETGAKTAVLNPIEGLTKAELASGKNYLTVMWTNLTTLADALVCEPSLR